MPDQPQPDARARENLTWLLVLLDEAGLGPQWRGDRMAGRQWKAAIRDFEASGSTEEQKRAARYLRANLDHGRPTGELASTLSEWRTDHPTEAAESRDLAGRLESDHRRAIRMLGLWLADEDLTEAWPDEITSKERRDLLHSVRVKAQQELTQRANTFLEEHASDGIKRDSFYGAVEPFFAAQSEYLRTLHRAALMGLVGHDLTPAQLRALRPEIEAQEAYLNRFYRDVQRGSQALDGTFGARLGKYARSSWGVAHNAQRRYVLKAGKGRLAQERRVHLGPDDRCAVCVVVSVLPSDGPDAGWALIGTLPPIGDSPCAENCHCMFEYRRHDGTNYSAGRF